MIVLLGIAFLAGVITAISPCVLPVLPIVLAGGASGGRRRPYAIIGYVSAQSASVNFGFRTVALAIAYAVGASVVLLGIALGGQRVAKPLRARVMRLRAALGVVVAGAALALVFNLDTKLQTSLPNWTNFLQQHTEKTAYAHDKLYTTHAAKPVKTSQPDLPDYGVAPSLAGGG